MASGIRDGEHIAETEEEKAAIYRLRYDVYVKEMGRYNDTADHDRGWLWEDEDETGHLVYAADEGNVVGAMRISWGGDGPFTPRQIQQYALDPFLNELPADSIQVNERGTVDPRVRGSNALLRVKKALIQFANSKRVQLCFGASEAHLLNLYLGLGYQTYAKRNINSAGAGYLIPMALITEDVGYLQGLGSPFADFAHDFKEDARIPECFRSVVAQGSAVTSIANSSSHEYWNTVHYALNDWDADRPTAFEGMTAEEESECLAKSSVLECEAGDRVLKKGGSARNIYVVLDGTLEVLDGDRTIGVLIKGDVFGEMAFLLNLPRTKDVDAVTDGVRVLSLSESTIRKLTDTHPATAAKLLLNLSKMLCTRLISTR
jgi:predicted GNAT family N-acyltransferase